MRKDGDGYEITFDLRQTGSPFSLVVPVTVYAAGKKETIPVKVDKENSEITLYSRELPERIAVDEDYDVMRRLSHEEIPPTIARLLGDKGAVVVLPPANKEVYKIMIDAFTKMGASIKETADDVLLARSSIIIFGNDNPMLERLRGISRKEVLSGGFTVSVFNNPYDPEKVITVINSVSAEETDAAFPKIYHYGKYSRLAFDKGRNILKEIAPSKKGLIVEIEGETPAVHVPDVKNLSLVIDAVRSKRIVYVGEEHTNYSHHRVQLEVVKRFIGQGGKIAIGMEMFQRPFQAVLDDYINGTIDQKTFLKKTEYFTRWGFDYDLYKPIIDYAREHRIPLIALNIDREIVEMVSKKGIAALTEEMKAKVPADMDLSDELYKDRLKKIFAEHDSIKDRDFDFFFQSQILWDETMSQTVSDYLSAHPDYRMIVLVGSGHIMYGSGIPKRAFRRTGLSYAVILSDAELDKDVADYVVFPRHIEGPQPARIMVLLKEDKGILTVTGFTEHSISKKAGLLEGDIIRSIDDVPMASIDDVKIFLFEKKKGDTIRIDILRKAAGSPEQEIKIDVTL